MDIDENDLLTTNKFIKNPDITTNIPNDANEQFKKYYEQELQKKEDQDIVASLDLKSLVVDETTDGNSLMNTNAFKKTGSGSGSSKNIGRKITEVKTLVSVDSRDRDKLIYSKPNHFKIFLGKTFYNVRTIKLVSVEFPNTNAVINSNNNNIYWRNKQDIDLDFTVTTNNITSYPIYSNVLRIGSYISSTLATEMQNKLGSIRRKQGVSNGNSILGDFHYFVITLDVDTDIVTFISLILTQLPNNPYSTTTGSGIITVTTSNHGLTNNQEIYMIGAKSTAGIAADLLNGFHQVTVISKDIFTFEVNVNASATVIGGGNVTKFGIQAPFQLLWGESSNTVAQNIGFPLENSSQMITTTISNLQNLYQMVITTTTPHGLSRTSDYIGNLIKIGYYLANNFVTYRSYLITDITDTFSLLVSISSTTIPNSLTNNSQAAYIQFGTSIPVPASSYILYSQQTFTISTKTPHGYTLENIGDSVTISGTSDPAVPNDTNYDGVYSILQVPSSTQLIFPGVLVNLNPHSSGEYGNIPKVKPITTNTAKIANIFNNFIQINGLYYTKIVCTTPHKLLANDKVMFYNVNSSPAITSASQTVSSVIDNYTFLIQFNMSTVSQATILNGTAYIGTGLITVSFPDHGFNEILNITNGSNAGEIIIQTVVPHNLKTGNTVRIMQTNTSPSINGGGYAVTYISADRFKITRSPIAFPTISVPSVVTGIIGMSNDFYLYGVASLGGILSKDINGIKFTVRDIIDINTFTFMISNIFATLTETGGGDSVFISSYLHGYNGTQTNTKNSLLNRSINLEGENYSFLTCPQLDTMKNTGSVSNIFARISLDQAPGYVCFNFLSEPKQFNTVPLDLLSELEFSVVNHDGSFYEFNDLDFSFTLEITEVQDTTELFNHSSRRGISDVS
jgi:hypothetical protein